MRGGRASYEHAPQPGELASSPTELVGVLPGPLTGHQAGETRHQRKRSDHSCWNWTKKVTTVFWSSGVYVFVCVLKFALASLGVLVTCVSEYVFCTY